MSRRKMFNVSTPFIDDNFFSTASLCVHTHTQHTIVQVNVCSHSEVDYKSCERPTKFFFLLYFSSSTLLRFIKTCRTHSANRVKKNSNGLVALLMRLCVWSPHIDCDCACVSVCKSVCKTTLLETEAISCDRQLELLCMCMCQTSIFCTLYQIGAHMLTAIVLYSHDVCGN